MDITKVRLDKSWAIALDRTGGYLYTTASEPAGVAAFKINRTTGLASAISDPVITGIIANDIVLHPNGRFAYTPNLYANSISKFNISPINGSISLFETMPLTSGTGPSQIVLSPDEQFAYSTNVGSNNISTFSVNPETGALTELNYTTEAGAMPSALTFTMSGEMAFATNYGSSEISIYSVNSETGQLTPLGTVPSLDGNSPIAIIHSP